MCYSRSERAATTMDRQTATINRARRMGCVVCLYELRSTWYAALPLAISLSLRAVGLFADVSLSAGLAYPMGLAPGRFRIDLTS